MSEAIDKLTENFESELNALFAENKELRTQKRDLEEELKGLKARLDKEAAPEIVTEAGPEQLGQTTETLVITRDLFAKLLTERATLLTAEASIKAMEAQITVLVERLTENDLIEYINSKIERD